MPVNRLLTNKDRKDYAKTVERMFELCPEMMSRKIAEANVQQAFTLDTALGYFKENNHILIAGAFEDTAGESLKVLGHLVVQVDPNINYDLHRFISLTEDKFDIIVSTSVLEHVENDEEFIEDCCQLLNSGGHAIFTMDFNDDYKVGDPLPHTDVRFYTKNDLTVRLNNVLFKNNCELVDKPNWSGKPDFVYQGHKYSFATFVFKKL